MRKFYKQNYFLIRRLHSLFGIIPVGAFFLVHMFLNTRAAQSPEQYQWVPDTLDEIPFIWAIEIGAIILPIVFHAILGAVIVWQGSPNSQKPALGWYANHAYTLQRVTGAILFVMIGYHLWQTWWVHTSMKLAGEHGFQIYPLMAGIVDNPIMLVLYALFVLIAAFHLGNGVYNFCCKWGVTTSKSSQKWAIIFGMAIGMLGVIMGFSSLWGLRFAPWAAGG